MDIIVYRRETDGQYKMPETRIEGGTLWSFSPHSIGRAYRSGFEPALSDNVHVYSIHAGLAEMRFRPMSLPGHPPLQRQLNKCRFST